MEKYKSGLSKDLNFSQMTRDKHILIADVFTYLNSQYARRTSNSSSNIDPVNLPPLGANRVKATFMNEPGEGSGVVRSFYSAFSESIIEMEYLPRDDSSNALNQSSSSSSRTAFQRALESTSENLKHLESLPLFARTSFGFLAPIPGNNSTSRKSAFRNVGRIIGLCLQQV
jgi:E3 ubiquitin-protein ligase EDD1